MNLNSDDYKTPCNRCGERKFKCEYPKTGAICLDCRKVYHDNWRANNLLMKWSRENKSPVMIAIERPKKRLP